MKTAQTLPTLLTIRFNAELRGTSLIVPKSANSKFSKGKTILDGTIYFFSFQKTSIEPDIEGNFVIKINKAMHNALSKTKEKTVPVEITRIGDEVETRVPSDLSKALIAHPKAKAVWGDITPLARRDWIFWMISGKQQETRAIRIAKGISKLSGGMRRVCCFAGINWLMKEGQ